MALCGLEYLSRAKDSGDRVLSGLRLLLGFLGGVFGSACR